MTALAALEGRVAALERKLGMFGVVPLPDYGEAIVRTVAQYYGITVEQLRGKSRVMECKWPRHVAAYVLRKNAQLSLSSIARKIGSIATGTTVHALDCVEDAIFVDKDLKAQVEYLVAITKKDTTHGAGEVQQNTTD